MVQPGVIFIRWPPCLFISSFASMRTPRCRHVLSVSHRNLHPGFEAQTRKPVTDGFEAQTTKLLASSVLHTRPSPMVLRTKPPNPRCRRVSDLPPSMTPSPSSLTRPTSLRQVPRRHHLHLELVDAIFFTMYTCTRRCPKLSATVASHLASLSLGPSLTSALHHSWSVDKARPPWPSPRRRLPPPCSTSAHYKSRDMHT
jgi:hypothetical protein